MYSTQQFVKHFTSHNSARDVYVLFTSSPVTTGAAVLHGALNLVLLVDPARCDLCILFSAGDVDVLAQIRTAECKFELANGERCSVTL